MQVFIGMAQDYVDDYNKTPRWRWFKRRYLIGKAGEYALWWAQAQGQVHIND